MSARFDALTSIKTKLGVLVAASVVVAALLSALGSAAGVPALLTVPVAVALALAVTQLLAAGMVAPLRRMTEVTQQMAAGDYSGRVHATASDEVGRLAAAFNTMAADLARVDHERRDLIATVSHELRTPLAAMTAILENLADGVVPADPPRLAEALTQAERLRDLVTALLDLSRLEAGATHLEPQSVAVAPLVAECVEVVVASGRAGEYDVAVPADLEVAADPGRLRQLLVNVLDNAARHGSGEQPIRVTAGAHEGGWWLEVVDDGPGVPAADRERAFERFGTDATGGGGTGLGLAISRWVATLHGGTLRFLDPAPDSAGARIRLELPEAPAPAPEVPFAGEPQPVGRADPKPWVRVGMTDAPPARDVGAPSALDAVFGRSWPEGGDRYGLRVVLTSAAVGVLGGALVTHTLPGLSWLLVMLAAGAAAFATARRRADAFTISCTALSVLLVLPVALLDSWPFVGLCVFTAAGVFLIGVTGARTLPGFLLTGVSWPLASLRGLPWLGRSVRLVGSGGRAPAVVRTVVWSLLGLLVFGALFASADALFATWVDALVPNLTFNDLVLRSFVAFLVFGLTLAAAYLALNPPRVDPDRDRPAPLGNRFEWLVPVLLVDAVFLVFLAAQAAAVFGGHAYIEETTGLTYAEHVHQGFGQLTVATALTLLVVWAAARRAGDTAADRLWLRLSIGLLCVLTLVVVASALNRMRLYQEAYGFTTLRVTVDVFEAWLGLVVLAVMVLGVLGRGAWLPRFALLSGALSLLALAAVNPDAWVAGRNIDRYEATGRLDLRYLQSLSADATPVIVERLPEEVAGCVLQYLPADRLEEGQSPLAWNLGRTRAADALEGVDLPAPPGPADDPCSALYTQFGERG
ncbi:histidine kinase [Nocardioides gansuensis]|uniref:Signal transduction histidine-protein kinase/phosphatase MprB n=1 Tax=Nocardioides gansuensis TaxID=2138300 RepID=A0A2T8FBI3_9ACTN|nr:histidine kinase [Nocardioides gansuensis]